MLLPTVQVILNPKSGGGHGGRLAREITEQLAARGVAHQLSETSRPGHARQLAVAAVHAGTSLVVAAGGDGTIHEVANGLLESEGKAALAVIPAGTGNDFAKIVPGAQTRTEAYDTIAAHALREYDVGFAEWPGGSEFFVNGMGTGIDVEVVRQIAGQPPLPGPLKYLLGLLRALAVYHPVTLEAQLPEECITGGVMMFAVGNGICQGGGFYLTPAARPDDGKLDMCMVRAMPLWRVPLVLQLVLRGRHAHNAAVVMRAFSTLQLRAVGRDPLFFQLDGELREPAAADWLRIQVRPRALRVATKE